MREKLLFMHSTRGKDPQQEEEEREKQGGKERERCWYGTYQIDMFGSMALQNCKQQVAAVPYNERKITLCTVILTEGKRASVREEREKSTPIAYLALIASAAA